MEFLSPLERFVQMEAARRFFEDPRIQARYGVSSQSTPAQRLMGAVAHSEVCLKSARDSKLWPKDERQNARDAAANDTNVAALVDRFFPPEN